MNPRGAAGPRRDVPPTPTGSYLLLLRDGGVWGVANGVVVGVGKRPRDYRVHVTSAGGGAELIADEVLGVVEELEVWPPSAVIRRYWPETFQGTAVHAGTPILLVDPDRPPRTLTEEQTSEQASTAEISSEISEEGEAAHESANEPG